MLDSPHLAGVVSLAALFAVCICFELDCCHNMEENKAMGSDAKTAKKKNKG